MQRDLNRVLVELDRQSQTSTGSRVHRYIDPGCRDTWRTGFGVVSGTQALLSSQIDDRAW